MRLQWRKNRLEKKSSLRDDEDALFALVKNSSDKNRNFLIAFIALLTFVTVAVASTTDLNLVLPEATLRLPILAVDVPILLFYAATPLFVVALHGDLLFNLVAHHKKLMAWRSASNQIQPEQIQPFLFDFAMLLAGGGGQNSVSGFSAWFRALVRLLSSFLVFWLAPITLSFTTWWFSAYQNWTYTAAHLAFVLADVVLVLLTRKHLRLNDPDAPRQGWWTDIAISLGSLAILAPAFVSATALLLLESGAGLQYWLAHNDETRWVGTSVDARTTSNEVVEYDADRREGIDSSSVKRSSWDTGNGITFDFNYGTYTSETFLITTLPAYDIGTTFSYLSGRFATWLTHHAPRRIDISNFVELRRMPVDAIKLRQIEDAINERDAWHEIGIGSQSIDLRGRRLRFANLSGVRLRYADLRKARLDGALLTNARLVHAKLDGASFRGIKANGSYFDGSSAEYADFSDAHLQSSKWHDVEMNGVRLLAARLTNAQFVQVKAYFADFSGAEATKALFLGSQLMYSRFDAASAEETSFARSDLYGVSFLRTNLYRARFHLANVEGANFRLALVQASRWRGAKGLSGTRGIEDAYASAGKLFVLRLPSDQIQATDVIRLLHSAKIDLRRLHDELACDANELVGQALLFGDRPFNQDAPVKIYKCTPSKVVLPTIHHHTLAQSYAQRMSDSLCRISKTETNGEMDSTEADYKTLAWLAEISRAYWSDGKSVHEKPHFSGAVFRQKLQQAECEKLRKRLSALPQATRLRSWLNGEGSGTNKRN